MSNIKSGIPARVHAPIPKLALSLCAALGIASAAKADFVLKEGTTTANWNDEGLWVGDSGNYVIPYTSANADITFTAKESIATGFWIENSADGLVVFEASDPSYGLVMSGGDMHVGGTNYGFLKIASGTHTFAEKLYVAFSQAWWDNPDPTSKGSVTVDFGTLNVVDSVVLGNISGSDGALYLNGGTLATKAIVAGDGTGKVVFNGGTAVATTAADGDFIPAASNYTVVVNGNGGTISNENDIKITAAVTGTGWLTKTGAGTLTLTDVAGFTGRIAVAENAGSVTLPASATNIKVGSFTTKSVTSEGIVFTYSATDYSNADNYWNGNGTDNDWATAGNWDTGLVGANNYVFHSGTLFGEPVSVEFAGAYTGDAKLYIENGTSGTVTFSKAAGADATAGVAMSDGIIVGTGTSGSLSIADGAYSAAWINIGDGTGEAALSMSDGTLSSAGDFNLGINGATARLVQAGGAITSGVNGWWGADNSKSVADINGGSVSFAGNLNLLNQNGTGDAASYITNTVAGGNFSANEIWFLGNAGHATVNLTSGTITTGRFGVNGSAVYALNLSGGTLKATADNATFIPASDNLTVTVDGNATLDTNGKTITIDAAMLGSGTLTCTGGGTVTFTSLNSTCTIVAANDGTIVNLPSAYYWIGGEIGNWSDGANWSFSKDGAAADAYPNAAEAMVVIPGNAAITLTETVSARVVSIDGTVALTSGDYYLTAAKIIDGTTDGTGLLALAGAKIQGLEFSNTISVNLKINAAETENVLYTRGLGNNTGASINVSSNISGEGVLVVAAYASNGSGSNVNAGINLAGTAEGFSGSVVYRQGRYNATYQARQRDSLAASASCENAEWSFYENNTSTPDRNSGYLFSTANGLYKFGAAHINLPSSGYTTAAGITFEIGNLDKDSEIRGTWGNAPTVNWVAATNVLAMSAKNNGNINITRGGTLNVTGSDIMRAGGKITYSGVDGKLKIAAGVDFDPSPYLAASGSVAITFDDEGCWREWSGDLGGIYAFTKDGAGTLTLSSVPAYGGPTKVLDGKLVVPFGTSFGTLELGDDATVEVDMTKVTPEIAANTTAFSVGMLTGDKGRISLVNLAADVEFELIETSTGLSYVNGSREFVWIGPSDEDYSWSNVANWSASDGQPVTMAPASADRVIFNTAIPGFTLSEDTSVMIATVNAAGFTYNAGYALNVLGDFIVEIPGTLTIAGTGSLNVGGAMSGVTSVTMTPTAATSAIVSAHPQYTEKIGYANALSLTSLTGGGTIESDSDQTVTVAEGTNTFYGTLSGAMGIVKDGAGTLELQGPNKFTGNVVINGGVLALSVKDYRSLIAYNFDASDTSKWSRTENNEVTLMQGASGWAFKSVGSSYATLVSDPTVFGGKTVMYLPATAAYRYNTDDTQLLKNKRAFSVFTVYQTLSLSGLHYLHYYAYSNSSNWDAIRLNGSSWESRTYSDDLNWALYLDGGRSRTAEANKKSVVSLIHEYAYNGNRNDQIGNNGSGFDGYVAEVVGLNQTVSIEHRASIDAYLMQKWGCDDATSYQFIPSTANVTMKSGATLDLGGMQQTVASFTGAGTVANGSLKTTGDLTVDGGTLTIQATAGQTYVLSGVETERLVLTGDAKGYAVKVPENGRLVGRFVVPEGIKVGLEGEDGLDVTVVNAPKGWELTGKPVAGGILYRVGSFPFVLRLR